VLFLYRSATRGRFQKTGALTWDSRVGSGREWAFLGLSLWAFFFFFAQTPPLMGVWFSVTTGDSKFLGLLMTWNNKNLGVCEYTYLCVWCLYVSL
jgi:hypothetical protein